MISQLEETGAGNDSADDDFVRKVPVAEDAVAGCR